MSTLLWDSELDEETLEHYELAREHFEYLGEILCEKFSGFSNLHVSTDKANWQGRPGEKEVSLSGTHFDVASSFAGSGGDYDLKLYADSDKVWAEFNSHDVYNATWTITGH